MASREQHLTYDLVKFGKEYPEVHRILDQFSHYPDMKFLKRHRKFLHHEEGIEYITLRYGVEAGASARLHVQVDCGHVPHAIDYYNGTVGMFGERK